MQGANQHIKSSSRFSILPKEMSTYRRGESNQRPSNNKTLGSTQSHSHPHTKQQVTATLLRNDTPVALNFNMNEFKIHCYILSWRSWTEIEKFNKLRKTFSRFLKAEKGFFFTSYTRLGPMISATSLHSSSWIALRKGYGTFQGQRDSPCTHQ